MSTFGAVAAVTSLPASASTLTSNSYAIGTPSGAVNGVTISPSSAVSTFATSFTVSFISTSALSGSSSNTITVTPSQPLTGTTGVALIDTASGCFQSGTAGEGGTGSINPVTGVTVIELSSNCTIASGQTVEVSFTATATANFDVTVTSSNNGTSAASNTVTVTSVPPTVSAGSESFGANSQYTFTDVGASGSECFTPPPLPAGTPGQSCGWGNLADPINQLVVVASLTSTAPTVPFAWDSAGSFTVTYTPSGGTATADTISSVTVGTTLTANDTVTLKLASGIPAGDIISVTGDATNPFTASKYAFEIEPEFLNTAAAYQADANNGTTTVLPGAVPNEVTGAVSYGTAVSAVTVSPSPLVNAASATYVATFKATSSASGDIFLSETTGPTNFSTETGVLISDTTANWHVVAAGVLYGTAVSGGGLTGACAVSGCASGAVEIPLTGETINAGDNVTVTMAGVTNPGLGTYSDFAVSTNVDTVAVDAPTYTLGASGSYGINVTVNPTTPAAAATYTVTNLYASAAITTGTVISLTADAGTVLPDFDSYYTITDTTTPSGSGTASGVLNYAAAGTSISFTVPNAINSGDLLTLTIGDVFNPGTGSYTLSIGGPLNGPTTVAPMPHSNVTYPNGALVNFSGTIYVFAGGHPFGIPTPTVLNKVRVVDPAAVETAPVGSVLPTTVARVGTLLTTNAVNAKQTIYVVGTDGELHGFSTDGQYGTDGYDPALAVTVPNMNGMTVGSTAGVAGTAVTALATSADGAIVDSSGTYYVFAGGRAFGIPGPIKLTDVRKSDKAVTLTGAITSTQTGTTIASGVLLSAASGIVYVTYVGDLFPFKTPTQLKNDGYAGSAAVPVPNTGGVSVVSTYSGS